MVGLKPKSYWFDFKEDIDVEKLVALEDHYQEKEEIMPEKL